MTFKNLLLFVFISVFNVSNAGNINLLPITPPTADVNDGGSCQLPPPANFEVVETGPTWVSLAWAPGSPFSQNNIKVFRVSDGTMLANVNTPPGTFNITITGLPAATLSYAEIRAICTNTGELGTPSPSGQFGLILDLVVNGMPPEGTPSDCAISDANEECPFSQTGNTSFMVRNRNNQRISETFVVNKNNEGHIQVNIKGFDKKQTFWFNCDDHEPNVYGGAKLQILHFSDPLQPIIATFDISTLSNSSNAYINWIGGETSDFEIVRMAPDPEITQPGDDRNLKTEHAIPLSITPNPFTDALAVSLQTIPTEPVNLALINLNGEKVLLQQFEGGIEQYYLQTAAVSPGFYFLRVEAAGEVYTLKVIKSE